MTESQINALVASAWNLRAAKHPELRARYVSGMRPADAAELSWAERGSLLATYRDHIAAVAAADKWLHHPAATVARAIDLAAAKAAVQPLEG